MWYKPKKVKKLALNSQLLTFQILTNDVQVVILCLSYFITTVKPEKFDFYAILPSQRSIPNQTKFMPIKLPHEFICKHLRFQK